jgi:NADPH:quinone reductase-like Zn-dependent oxidoreductase
LKAIRIHETGGAGCLIHEEVPGPEPQESEFLIRVHAAGVNPVDTKIRSGKFPRFRPTLPAILGRDISGTILKKGAGAAGFEVDDEVIGLLDYDHGAYAEYTIASARELVRRPPEISREEAAALPVAALTAWQALFEHGKLRRHQSVLVHGAGGGVGHFAVQLAAWRGATVTATCSSKDIDFILGLGAQRAIDYKTERFEEQVRDVDLVVDLVGSETRQRSWQTLKSGGILVSTLPAPEPEGRKDVSGREVVLYASSPQLQEITNLVAAGNIMVHIDRKFPLRDAAKAHLHLEEEHPRGKTILLVSIDTQRRES